MIQTRILELAEYGLTTGLIEKEDKTYTINKLNRGDNVTTDVLVKICKALDCSFDDIMEVVDDSNGK